MLFFKSRASQYQIDSERLALLDKYAGVGLWDLTLDDDWRNPQHEFTFSSEFRRILGYRDDKDFPNLMASWVDNLHPDEAATVIAAFEAARTDKSGRTVYDISYRLKTKEGSYRWIRATCGFSRDHDGTGLRACGSMIDIHAEREALAVSKKAEAELLEKQVQLIRADKLAAIGTLASGIAHEINNPNGLLLLNIAFLKRLYGDLLPLLDENGISDGYTLGGIPYFMLRGHLPRLLNDMEAASTRIGEIVDDLKDFARPDSTQWDTYFCPNEPARAALRLLEHILRKATDKLHVSLAPDLPQICGSPQKIEQVLINLIVNACQALENRDQGLAIVTDWNAAKNEILFVVRDEGCGIPAENIPLLRDPFFTTKREIGGTGLGLSISDTIIKAHGGVMDIESQSGVGTTITLHLPIAKQEEAHGQIS